jgi:hypothetical protein
VFSPAQLQALTHFSFATYGFGGSAPVFYGAAAIFLGHLIYILGGWSQVTNTFCLILAPAYAFFWEMVPLLLALLALAVWFRVRGIDVMKWTRSDAACIVGP